MTVCFPFSVGTALPHYVRYSLCTTVSYPNISVFSILCWHPVTNIHIDSLIRVCFGSLTTTCFALSVGEVFFHLSTPANIHFDSLKTVHFRSSVSTAWPSNDCSHTYFAALKPLYVVFGIRSLCLLVLLCLGAFSLVCAAAGVCQSVTAVDFKGYFCRGSFFVRCLWYACPVF